MGIEGLDVWKIKGEVEMEVILREGMLRDLSFLREMLFEAAFWRPSVTTADCRVGGPCDTVGPAHVSFKKDRWSY